MKFNMFITAVSFLIFITVLIFLIFITLFMIDLHWHLFQPGFGTGESSETSLQLFIVGLGRHHTSLVSLNVKKA